MSMPNSNGGDFSIGTFKVAKHAYIDAYTLSTALFKFYTRNERLNRTFKPQLACDGIRVSQSRKPQGFRVTTYHFS